MTEPRRTPEGRVIIEGSGWHNVGSARVEYDDAYQFVPDGTEVMASWPKLARTYTSSVTYQLRDTSPEVLALLFGFTWNEVMDRLHPHIERGEN